MDEALRAMCSPISLATRAGGVMIFIPARGGGWWGGEVGTKGAGGGGEWLLLLVGNPSPLSDNSRSVGGAALVRPTRESLDSSPALK